MTNAELLALLREARESIAQDFDSGPAGRRTLLDLLKRIDAALAAQDIKPSPADIKWEEKDSNRHGISPHEADYSDDVFLTVEKHWLCGQWLFRVEYVAYAASKDEAKAKAVEYAGRLP